MKTLNLRVKIEPYINIFVENLKRSKEVVGIILLGGLGKRGFIDKYSDLDVGVFYDSLPNKNLPPFSFRINITDKKKFEFNVSQQLLSSEKDSIWGDEKRHAYSNGTLIFDKDGVFKKFLDKKLLRNANSDYNRLVEIFNQYNWKVRIHTISSYYRGYPESSNLLINDGLQLLTEAVFILNLKNVPHLKWTIYDIEKLNYLPCNFLSLYKEALLCKTHSLKVIKKRILILEAMENELLLEVKKQFSDFPSDTYLYWAKNLSGRQIFKNTFAEEFTTACVEKLTNQEAAQLHGYIAYNLIADKESLFESLSRQNYVVDLNSAVKEKLRTILI